MTVSFQPGALSLALPIPSIRSAADPKATALFALICLAKVFERPVGSPLAADGAM